MVTTSVESRYQRLRYCLSLFALVFFSFSSRLWGSSPVVHSRPSTLGDFSEPSIQIYNHSALLYRKIDNGRSLSNSQRQRDRNVLLRIAHTPHPRRLRKMSEHYQMQHIIQPNTFYYSAVSTSSTRSPHPSSPASTSTYTKKDLLPYPRSQSGTLGVPQSKPGSRILQGYMRDGVRCRSQGGSVTLPAHLPGHPGRSHHQPQVGPSSSTIHLGGYVQDVNPQQLAFQQQHYTPKQPR